MEKSEEQEWIIEMINNILIEVLSSMAEQERLTIRKHQRQGIDAAKKKKTQNTRGPKVHDEEPEDFDYDEGYTDDEDDYGDYDEEQEAELDRWLAGLDDGQDEDR